MSTPKSDLGLGGSGQLLGRSDIEKLYEGIRRTMILISTTDCAVPVGEDLICMGLFQMPQGESCAAAIHPPAIPGQSHCSRCGCSL